MKAAAVNIAVVVVKKIATPFEHDECPLKPIGVELFMIAGGRGGGEGGQGGQNLPPPVPCPPASRTFISRLPPFSVLFPSPVNWQNQNTS